MNNDLTQSFSQSIAVSIVNGAQTSKPFDNFDADSLFSLADDLERMVIYLRKLGEEKETQ